MAFAINGRAEVKFEESLKMGNKKNLAVLATGSGKTYLACLAAYRLLNYTPTKRILFLVDRNNLARQTESEFSVFDRTEGQQKLGNLYTINRLKKEEDIKGDIVISTIQKLFCVLTGQKINDSDEDAEDEKAKADEEKDNLPVVLTDISFVIKKTVINSMRNSSDHAYIKGLAEYVKNTIYEKANNILLLSIIESIGMNYQKEMPGYALELASSMELIYFDIHRSGEFISNPTKELLEKQIMLSMGVPEITRRYEKDEKCACNLQQYFANSYLCGDEGIKNRCHVILDYLYSIYDEKTYPNENLQIQKMDFRDAAMTAIDEKTIMIEPQIKGEAQKIVKNNEDENEPLLKMNEILNRLISDINEKKADADQIVSVIDTLCEKMKGDYRIEIQFESILVTLIASALIMPDVS